MKKLSVLVAFDYPLAPPEDGNFSKYITADDWRPIKSVVEALERLGHEAVPFPVFDDIVSLVIKIKRTKPDFVFNLMESFEQNRHYESHLVSLLELLKVPYSGCSPMAVTLCKNKFLTKRILGNLRIRFPRSVLFERGNTKKNLTKLRFPLIVKPVGMESSDGIAQASYVEDEAACLERVSLLHNSFNVDAMAEEYIEGREIYCAVVGAQRLRALPLREMIWGNFPEGRPKFATFKAKWDYDFRRKYGITNTFARAMDAAVEKEIYRISKAAFRALGLSGYARLDFRLTPDNHIYLIEVNPNPGIANNDEVAYAAQRAGITYDSLIASILSAGLKEIRT